MAASTAVQQDVEPRSVEEILEEMHAEDRAKWEQRMARAKAAVKQAAYQFTGTAKAMAVNAGLQGAGLDMFMGRSLDGMGRMAVAAGVSYFLQSDGPETAQPEAQEDKSAMYVPDDSVLVSLRAQDETMKMQGIKPKKLLYTNDMAKRMTNGDITRAMQQGLLQEPDGQAVREHMADMAGGGAAGVSLNGVRIVDKIKKLPNYHMGSNLLGVDGLDRLDLVDGSRDVSKLYENAMDDMQKVTERDRMERGERPAGRLKDVLEGAAHVARREDAMAVGGEGLSPDARPGLSEEEKAARREAEAKAAFGLDRRLGDELEGPGWGDYGG